MLHQFAIFAGHIDEAEIGGLLHFLLRLPQQVVRILKKFGVVFFCFVSIFDEHDEPGGSRVRVNFHISFAGCLFNRIHSRLVHIIEVEVGLNMVDQPICEVLIVPTKTRVELRFGARITLRLICNEIGNVVGPISVGDFRLI